MKNSALHQPLLSSPDRRFDSPKGKGPGRELPGVEGELCQGHPGMAQYPAPPLEVYRGQLSTTNHLQEEEKRGGGGGREGEASGG